MQVISLNLFGGQLQDVVLEGNQSCVLDLRCDDLYNNHEKMYEQPRWFIYPHFTDFLKGKEDWPVVCNVRNPTL